MVAQAAGQGTGPPMGGRERELSLLEDFVASVDANGAAALVIGGEAGIGKSTLIETFARRMVDRACLAMARCSTHDFDALQPLRSLVTSLEEAAGQAVAAIDAATIAPWSGTLPTTAEEIQAVQAQQFTSLTDRLLAASGTGLTLMVIDDVHWGQPLLHQFLAFFTEAVRSRRRNHRLAFVLVTRLLPPPHPVARLLEELSRDPRSRRIELGELHAHDVAGIVENAVPGRPSSAFLDLVRRSARGNPLRALAALRVLAARGIEADVRPADDRTWGTIRFPPELADPVTAWAAQLPADTRAALTVAATWGEEFTIGELSELTGIPVVSLAPLVDGAVRSQLLNSDGRRHWFGHALYGEVVTQLADPSMLRRSHAACAARLGPVGRADASDASVLRQAAHVLAAGDEVTPPERLECLTRATEAALRATSWTDAMRFGEAARQLASETGAADHVVAPLLSALGLAYYFDHDFRSAEAVLPEAIERAAAGGYERIWGDALVTWLRIRMLNRADALSQVPPDEAAWRFLAVARDPQQRSLVLQVLAEHHITAGDTDAGADLANQALTEAERSGDDAAQAMALYASAFAHNTAMRLDTGLAGVRAALSRAKGGDNWYVTAIMGNRLTFALAATGHLEEADREALTSIADAERRQEHSNQALGYSVRASAALLRGDFAAFDELAERARSQTERSGYVLADLFVGPTVVLSHLYRGDVASARALADTWPNLPRSGRTALHAALALLGADGPPPDLRPPRVPTQVTAGFFAASLEAALARGDSSNLADAAALLEAWTGDGFEFPPSYPTSLTRLRAEIALAQGELDHAGYLFDAALARASANGAQLELARCLAGAARRHRALRSAADIIEAERLADRAGALATLIGLHPAFVAVGGMGDYRSRRPMPAGEGSAEVAVLITDVVGSTEVSRQLGDLIYFELIMTHHELVRACLRQWAGTEFSESGDGLLASFTSVSNAVEAARMIQARAREDTLAQRGLHVKVSVAAGAALVRAGRPYGLVLNRAARLLDEAGAADIVVDANVAARLGEQLGTHESREAELRGIGRETITVLRDR